LAIDALKFGNSMVTFALILAIFKYYEMSAALTRLG
jgi:hypothetical protein